MTPAMPDDASQPLDPNAALPAGAPNGNGAPAGAADPIQAAEAAIDSLDGAAAALQGVLQGPANDMSLLGDVDLRVRIELGRTRMFVEDVLRLSSDSVIELDKAAGDPVDIYVNDRHVARGEVLVLNESFCVRVSEILASHGDDT